VDLYADRTSRTAELVERLHEVVEELERLHPGRKFPLDGHLVGSLGEAAGEAAFEVKLEPTGNAGYDAVSADGRKVEIKATYGNGAVAIRPTSHDCADALIVLRLSRRSDETHETHETVYNGPFAVAAAGRIGSNGQAPVRLSRLRGLNASIAPADRIPLRRGGLLMPDIAHN
jgi:hypothetical protein